VVCVVDGDDGAVPACASATWRAASAARSASRRWRRLMGCGVTREASRWLVSWGSRCCRRSGG